MKRIVLYAITLSALLFSCNNENENECDNILFKGITQTDEQALIISKDESDWNFFDHWCEQEHSLFEERYESFCDSDHMLNAIAFPNPSPDIVMFSFSVPSWYRISYRVVNRNFQVLISEDSAASFFAISFNNLNVANDIVRVYYKIYGEGCELRGHGDIKIF